jgi:hypothetical protein
MKETSLTTNKVITDIQAFSDVFGDIDFSKLNSVIEALAGKGEKLSMEEKKSALEIIDSWEEDIINSLRIREQEMKQFLNYFDIDKYNQWYHDSSKRVLSFEQEATLAEKTETKEYFEKLCTAKAALDLLKKEAPEELEPTSLDQTVEDRLQKEADFKLQKAKYQINLDQAKRKCRNAEKVWLSAMNQNSYIKDILFKAKSYQRNLQKFTQECSNKSNLAKLNITINSAEVRDSLKELLNFKITF